MSDFEFVFTLFGLVLGLALAEIFGGLRSAIQSRTKIRIGTLTPLLGLIVAFDLVSFWLAFWEVRDAIPINLASLLVGLAVTGLYYLVAGLVFPGDPAEWPDHDAYYFAHKKLVFAGIALVNALGMAAEAATGAHNPFASAGGTAATLLFFALVIFAIWLPGRRANIALLTFIAVMYPAWGLAYLLIGPGS